MEPNELKINVSKEKTSWHWLSIGSCLTRLLATSALDWMKVDSFYSRLGSK